MGKLTLYGIDGSPPVRAVLLTLKALQLPYEYKQVNILTKEQLSPEYLKINPQHTVPTLEDDGNFLWDSHAIMAYLVEKYGKTDELYPKDLLQRAVVAQRLYFEAGVVFASSLVNIMKPLLKKNETNIMAQKIEPIVEAYNFLEVFLKDTTYVAGNNLTIADFSLVASITSLTAFKEINANNYPKINAWIERLQQLPYYHEANGKGLDMFLGLIKSLNARVIS